MPVLSRSAEGEANREEAEGAFLEAAAALLAEQRSYAELSIGEIAQRAGKTRTAFYFYFHDKRELLMRLTEQVAATLYDEADRWWSGHGGPDDLRVALTDILGTYREHGPLLRAVVEASTYDEQVGTFWREIVGRFIESTRARLEAEGRCSGDAAEATAFVLVWMTERVCYQQVARGGKLDDNTLVDALADVWTRAVYAGS